MTWQIEQRNGFYLPDLGWFLDARKLVAKSFVSHAHFDHMGDHETILCSPPTAKLIQQRIPGNRNWRIHNFGEAFEIEPGIRACLYPAGHIVGSSMLWLEKDGQSFLYTGELLKLPNIWNPIGARILEAKGHLAVATASAAISAALGYADGELISRDTLVEQITRIARSIEIPLTADIETGFGETTDELAETVRLVLAAGAVGINLEDSIDEDHSLRPVGEQCERIATARATAKREGINLYINARIDAFFCHQFQTINEALAEIEIRAHAYLQAGANGIYPIGNSALDVVKQLRGLTDAPINVLALPTAATPTELEDIGINRLSYGPFVFRTCLQTFHATIDAIEQSDSYDSISPGFSTEHVGPYLRLESEQA